MVSVRGEMKVVISPPGLMRYCCMESMCWHESTDGKQYSRGNTEESGTSDREVPRVGVIAVLLSEDILTIPQILSTNTSTKP